MPALSKRDQLVNTALAMFTRDGFHSTGINGILEEAGVAKMTLYKYFKSKDELVVAALRLRDERFRDWFMQYVEADDAGPRERLLRVFDALNLWFNDKSVPGDKFRGCTFVNAASEYHDIDNPVRSLCAEHKRMMSMYLRGLVVQAGLRNPDSLAQQLNLLVEGAISNAYVCGDKNSALTGKAAAEALIKAAG